MRPVVLVWLVTFAVGCGSPSNSPPPASPPKPAFDPVEAAHATPSSPASADSARAGALPDAIEATLSQHARCEPSAEQRSCVSLFPPATPLDAAAPATLWSQQLMAKAVLTLPPDPRVDLYAVVLAGSVRIDSDASGSVASTTELTRWHAFHAPGAGVVLSSPSGARLVMALATGGEPLARVLASAPPAPAPGKLARFDFNEADDLSWADGRFHARLGVESGRASFQLMISSADAAVPPHDHAASWEVIALVEADGAYMRASKPGESIESGISNGLGTGAVVAVPPGVQHAWQPTGAKPLVALQLYVPPGPEQRFKTLAQQHAAPKRQ